MAGDRAAHPRNRGAPFVVEAGGVRDVGRCARKPGERQADRGDAAPVDRPGRPLKIVAGERGDGGRHPLLHRMVARDIALRRLAQCACRDQEGGVLARTHVVDREPAVAGAHAGMGGRRVVGQVGAAFEVVLAKPGAREPAAHDLHMGRLTVVRRAGKRDLLVGHRMTLGSAGFDQRQNLNRLDRRARIDDRLGLAPALHEPSGRVDHRDIHQVPALDRGVPRVHSTASGPRLSVSIGTRSTFARRRGVTVARRSPDYASRAAVSASLASHRRRAAAASCETRDERTGLRRTK